MLQLGLAKHQFEVAPWHGMREDVLLYLYFKNQKLKVITGICFENICCFKKKHMFPFGNDLKLSLKYLVSIRPQSDRYLGPLLHFKVLFSNKKVCNVL